MTRQITDTVLMVRPVGFRMNEETAVNNFFQEDIQLKNEEINLQAQKEFDDFVNKLQKAGVNVVVVEDKKELDTPDSIFPNNWVSFHEDGTAVIYPMFAVNRRRERRMEFFEALEQKGYKIEEVLDYTGAEEEEVYLEGTGSMILDRVNQKAYCSLSPRANEDLFIEFCEDMEFTPVIFTAYQDVDGERKPIYHTNVMMCVAENFAVICLDSIDDPKERKNVVRHLKEDKKEVIKISEAQVHNFAGNMLQVKGAGDKKFLVMSSTAYNSLEPSQIERIEKHCEILSAEIDTIETCGGGSTRCMLAEVFLPKV
ncbi:amidinotransferase [Antarcticibacterium flavum]|uniref:Amidinotransferase n=1 Tax=Antarcticibacterium flavum TaxID=2058175 RepID=A0A5B7X9A9_9FLAO|nr:MULTISPECIES: arginine deiminase-related protein [Antarcticibacterium]MCM4160410.1 amidinotransferase [Antarcticibacterium sp. W02-3]QCY71382.1 amidinotransferase [Antarcticibacterium flavum]